MARNCNCSGSTCGCQVMAGTGIAVTGIGTAADPFVITNTGASLAQALSVQDTSTLDLVKTGSGTNLDPTIISGNVTLKMQQLIDVSNPGGNPVAGQAPQYVGVSGAYGHWEFKGNVAVLPSVSHQRAARDSLAAMRAAMSSATNEASTATRYEIATSVGL